jgi:hypothetical protein
VATLIIVPSLSRTRPESSQQASRCCTIEISSTS